jgi:hypothetical protein
MTSPPDPHYRQRFPAEIIGYAVWLYHRRHQLPACGYREIRSDAFNVWNEETSAQAAA